MHALTEDSCKAWIARAGVGIHEHRGDLPNSLWHEVKISDAASYTTRDRVGGHEPAFNLAASLLLADSGAPHGWVLWLWGRVYTNDRFAVAFFQLLNHCTEPGRSGVQPGYFFDESESELCAAIVALIMLAEWDAVVARDDGSLALTLEHDGLIIYQIKERVLRNHAAVEEHLDLFGFRAMTD